MLMSVDVRHSNDDLIEQVVVFPAIASGTCVPYRDGSINATCMYTPPPPPPHVTPVPL